LRQVIPLLDQTVSVALPKGRTGADARLLVTGKPVKVTISDGRASIRIDAIREMEAVHFIWK
jgi:hypothetical protein